MVPSHQASGKTSYLLEILWYQGAQPTKHGSPDGALRNSGVSQSSPASDAKRTPHRSSLTRGYSRGAGRTPHPPQVFPPPNFQPRYASHTGRATPLACMTQVRKNVGHAHACAAPLRPKRGIMFEIMRDQGNHLRIRRPFILPTAVLATLLAGLIGLACSSSGLETNPGDAGAVGGSGQTGGNINNGSTGGVGGSSLATSAGDAAPATGGQTDGTSINRTISVDGGVTTFGSCSLSTDYVTCNGNMFLYCMCTENGPLEGYDLAGSSIYSCDSSAWVAGTVCSVACNLTVAPQSGCIASEKPVPECSQDGPACWNGNITNCQNGYPLPTTPCGSGTRCTPVAGCGALCLDSSATVDSRCPATTVLSGFCEDNTAYLCQCGYLVGSTVCGAAPNDCGMWGSSPQCGYVGPP